MIQIYGFINRSHLMKKFRVSIVQASHDLRDAANMWPHLIKYDKYKKSYTLKEPQPDEAKNHHE